MISIAEQIAQELNVQTSQITSAISLLDDGATVPFIARYRKELTNGLDDNHLRHLDQRLAYLRELADRRKLILTNIEQQGNLSVSLRKEIEQADNKTRLEDLYLPYRPKRRTKGQIAIEAGLKPLANKLYQDWLLVPTDEAQNFINAEAGFVDDKSVLDGVLAILIERFAEDANLLQKLRKHLLKQAHLSSKVVKGKSQEGTKFKDYFVHAEKLRTVPSHRMLAMLRGRNEGFLKLHIDVDPGQEANSYSSAEQLISEHYNLRLNSQAGAAFLAKVVRSAWKTKLSQALETDLLGNLREQAEVEAIKVFASNLSDLLMAAPAGAKTTLGLDPGMRTGCKIAVVDGTGKLLQTATIFPHAPQNHWDKSVRTLVNLCQQHKVELVAIGNGTGSRESDKLIGEVITALSEKLVDQSSDKPTIKLTKIIISEAGASVYSASEFAANEFPDLDVSIRGAVSIARRLQDPLAELVKIDPKAIGVGQYQHDVSQSQLIQSLDNVIEDCVNAVGVDLNSASAALLTRVSGLNKTMAQNIVNYRDEHGRFNDRKELKKVPRLGPKAFEQAAGFLRITDGKNPLDMSGVHPETYPVVEAIIAKLNIDMQSVLGNSEQLNKIDSSDIADQLINSSFGELTVKDIINELEKPSRDPRPEFKTAVFKDGVNTVADLTIGMILEGVISNVANFGAFVDIGVHQDGLVHISSLTNKFVSDPREIVKAGDVVKVKVVEVDSARKRISLTMRLDDANPTRKNENEQKNKVEKSARGTNKLPQKKSQQERSRPVNKAKESENAAMGNAFADAFAKLKQ
jgi:uncharacterized protein